jgi:hypothetical protein
MPATRMLPCPGHWPIRRGKAFFAGALASNGRDAVNFETLRNFVRLNFSWCRITYF